MAYKTTLQGVQIAFLKRLIWKRYRNRIPQTDFTKTLLDQLCLRIKIDGQGPVAVKS